MKAIIAAKPAVPKFKVPTSVATDPSTAVSESLPIPEVENAAEVDGAKPPETTPSATPSAAHKLLGAMWRSDRIHQLGTLDRKTGKFRNLHVNGIAAAIALVQNLSAEHCDIYFALADYLTPNSRIAANAYGASALWADVDCGAEKADAGKGYATLEDARLALTQFCKEAGLPEPTHTVDSGSGLHVYWALDKVVEREVWQAYAAKFKALTHTLKFLADDSRTADIASVLRVPGTLNYKYSPPRAVVLLWAFDTFIEQAEFFAAIDNAHAKLCPAVIKTAPLITADAVSNQSSHNGMSSSSGREFSSAELRALLEQLDPDMEYGDWTRIAMAIHHVTGGSDDGLEIFDEWSGRGAKYKGTGEIRIKWRSLKSDRENCYNIGTIINMVKAKGIDWRAVCSEAADPFEKCETIVEYADRKLVATPQPATQDTTSEEAAKFKAKTADSAALAAMQKQFALIQLSGKFCVFDQVSLATPNKKGKAQQLVLSNRIDGNLMIVRALRVVFPKANAQAILDEFWVSPQTVCYEGIDFDPSGVAGNHLNLWVGPTIVPRAGCWVLIKAFLLDVICDGDQVCFQYLLCYIAHALQHPEEKPGVMIILIGGQGIGKGTVARILGKIWGATFLQISNVDSVTGNFNASLERAYIVFMDEALFAGDRKAANSLKSLVTEPVIHINEKHQPARQTSSFHRFFAATNADHLKNTDRDDRRDFTLRVSEARKGDHEYWMALNHEIDNGGVEAMVHDLLAMDLSNFNVRAKPDTKELLEQKLQSLDPIPRWWHECLCSGELSVDGDWPEFIATEDFIEGIWKIAGGKMHKKPAANDVAQGLKKLCPSASKAQKKSDGLCRKRGFSLPPLDQARTEFDAYIGGAVKWDAPPNAGDIEAGAAASGEP